MPYYCLGGNLVPSVRVLSVQFELSGLLHEHTQKRFAAE